MIMFIWFRLLLVRKYEVNLFLVLKRFIASRLLFNMLSFMKWIPYSLQILENSSLKIAKIDCKQMEFFESTSAGNDGVHLSHQKKLLSKLKLDPRSIKVILVSSEYLSPLRNVHAA